jgi:hypothetical protein
MRILIFNNNFFYSEEEFHDDEEGYKYIDFIYYNKNIDFETFNDYYMNLYEFIKYNNYEDFYLSNLYFFIGKSILEERLSKEKDSERNIYIFNENILSKDLISYFIKLNPKIINCIKEPESFYGYYSLLKKAFLKDNYSINFFRVPLKYKKRLVKDFPKIFNNQEFKDNIYEKKGFKLEFLLNWKTGDRPRNCKFKRNIFFSKSTYCRRFN